MLTPNKRQTGVTLIELVIAIALLGLLVGMGVPAFRSWIQNSQVRVAADAVLSGMQLARTEAIRRNKPVEFVLRTGADWSIVLVSPRTTLQERKGSSGSKNAVMNATPGGADRITFNPIGAPASSNQDGSFPIQQIDITSSQTVDGLRPLRVVVSVSGAVRMCDPDSNLPAGDPRRCTF
jgi:type IV fimbrial biogenesis protein FimT